MRILRTRELAEGHRHRRLFSQMLPQIWAAGAER
jgi:hypothetical protein